MAVVSSAPEVASRSKITKPESPSLLIAISRSTITKLRSLVSADIVSCFSNCRRKR
jgi:hypothetical protein